MDSDVRIVVVILPAVTCLVLLGVIWLSLMRIRVVGSVGGFAHGLGVCLGVLRSSAPAVLSLILFALMHGDK